MSGNNESLVIYQTWFENAGKLGEEKQTKAMMQIIRYGLFGEVPDNKDDLFLDLLLSDWMPLVDAQKKKRKGGAPKGNKNASGHGAPKGNKNASKTNNKNKQPFNVNGNDNGNVNANINTNTLPSASASVPVSVTEDAASGDGDGWIVGERMTGNE